MLGKVEVKRLDQLQAAADAAQAKLERYQTGYTDSQGTIGELKSKLEATLSSKDALKTALAKVTAKTGELDEFRKKSLAGGEVAAATATLQVSAGWALLHHDRRSTHLHQIRHQPINSLAPSLALSASFLISSRPHRHQPDRSRLR